MTIEKRIKQLESIEKISDDRVRGVMYVCDEVPADVYRLSVGEHNELIQRHQDETQEAFDNRAYERMESFYQRDKSAPVAFLMPTRCSGE